MVPDVTRSQTTLRGLLLVSVKRTLACAAIALFLWLGLLFVVDANPQLLAIVALQLSFLTAAFRLEAPRVSAKALASGALIALAAVALGFCYDAMLRVLFGPGSPTIGPWGEVRRMAPLPRAVMLAVAVLIGPAGDESFFRADFFGTWQAAGRPWSGALLSSAVFALARLDPWNIPAYFGLGMLLCWAFRRTESVLAVWTAHALLNAGMFGLLFSGYE